jgi:pyridoxamine 5'-phosphate oxidase
MALLLYMLSTACSTLPCARAFLASASVSTYSVIYNPVSRFGRANMSSKSSSVPENAGHSGTTESSKHNARSTHIDPLTPWREMIAVSSAKARKVKGGNFVQISSIDPISNEPRCRTVVFRGFQKLQQDDDADMACTMKMITNSRSSKVAELSGTQSPHSVAELVWWFSKSSEQYRVRGNIQFIGEDTNKDGSSEFLRQSRKEQWGNMSDPAREQFYWKNPGEPYSGTPSVPPGGRGEDGKVLPPPKEFLLMLLHPQHVDYLRLTDNYHQIDHFNEVTRSWETQRVNP